MMHSHREKELGPPSDSHFYAPYIGSEQIIMILDLLERLKPRKCLEWGSGWSTVFFPRFTPGAMWISIEHLSQFVKLISPYLLPNVNIIQKGLGKSYVEEPLNWVKGQPFDFVFIDGEGRNDCVKIALQILRKGGIVVQHDASPLENLRGEFEEKGRIGGLWWGRK